MNLKREIEKRFRPILEAVGFQKHSGPWLSYIKREPDIHFHVDIENHYYSNAFSVTLQAVDRNGNRKQVDLSDFDNQRDYEYPGDSTTIEDKTSRITKVEETTAVIERACLHLKTYGIPWLDRINAE